MGGAPQPRQRAAAPRLHRPIVRARLPPLPDGGRRGRRHLELRASRSPPEGQPLPPLPAVDPLPPAWDYPGHFRAAAAAHLSRIRGRASSCVVHPAHHDERDGRRRARADASARRRWRTSRARRSSTGDNVLPPTAPGVTPVGTETVMMAPSFPQPMYEPLKEQSQDLLLPGLDTVLPDTVLGLRTNRAFVEAYMVGLNFEMGRELLWRGFPTDQRGTYFRHFWGTDAGRRGASDIDDLRKNLGRALGTAPAERAGRTSSCCCCAAACCAAIRTRSSI